MGGIQAHVSGIQVRVSGIQVRVGGIQARVSGIQVCRRGETHLRYIYATRGINPKTQKNDGI